MVSRPLLRRELITKLESERDEARSRLQASLDTQAPLLQERSQVAKSLEVTIEELEKVVDERDEAREQVVRVCVCARKLLP